ncbi:MAG: M16 family metallopeptidase [Planctomycetota bacterium]|jgi:zinc protease
MKTTILKIAIFSLFILSISGLKAEAALWGRNSESKVNAALDVDRKLVHPGNITEVLFKNGLKLYIRENHASSAVSVRVFVKIGSIYEGKMQGSGVSHYFEHIIAGGSTKSSSEAENKRILEKIGNNSNAYTTRDHTAYYITTEGSHVSTAVNLLADYMVNCRIDRREFQRERGVIIQEIRKNRDNPRRELHQLLNSTMFPDHPAGQPVIGFEELFKNVTRNQVIDFYKRYYTSNNTIVVVVGDINTDKITASTAKAFRYFKRGIPNHPVIPAAPQQTSLQWAEKENKNIRNTYMLMGHHTVMINHPDLFALDVLSQIIGGGRSSRLYTALRAKGLVQSIYSYSYTPQYDAGNFVIGAVLDTKLLGKVQQVILDEIYKVQDKGVTKEEIRRAAKQIASSYTFGLETSESQASDIGRNVLSTGDPAFTDKYLEGLKRVTSNDILTAAKKYLVPQNRTVAIMKPAKKQKAKSSKPADTAPSYQKIEKIVLRNGLKMIYGYDNTVESTLVQLSCLGGVRSENPDNSGICRLMSKLLLRGTRKMDAETLHKEVENVGAKIYSNSGNNSWYAGIKTLPEDFEKGIKLLSEVILTPSFPEKHYNIEKSRQIQIVKTLDDSWQAEASRFFRKKYFKDHPYAKHPAGSVNSLSLISLKNVKTYHKNHLSTDKAVLAVFGNIEREEAVKLAEKYFILLPLPLQPDSMKDNSNPAPDNSLYLKENKKSQVVLNYGFKGKNYGSDDIYAIDILDTIISGYGYPAGWLHEALRGRNDLVYLIHAYNWAGLGTGVFQIITQTSSDNVEKVMSNIDKVIQRAALGKITEEEFNTAKQILLISNNLNRESLTDRATQSSYDELYGKGFDYYKKFEEKLNKTTIDDVKKVAAEILKEQTITATGNKEGLEKVKGWFIKKYPENAEKVFSDTKKVKITEDSGQAPEPDEL